MNLAAIRTHYGIPAYKGGRVRAVHPTRPSLYATIVGAVTGSIVVETDGPHIRGELSRCHWSPLGIQYLDETGEVIFDATELSANTQPQGATS